MTDKLWGGRFAEDITSEVLDYTLTTDIDERLVDVDIWQDIAHVLMLGEREIVTTAACRELLSELLKLDESQERGELVLRPEFEDVHLNIEQFVIEGVGPEIGGRMHTARSRNDQVSTDTRMYLRTAQLDAVEAGLDLIDVLLDHPESDLEAVLPGYTHSQAAQPISVAFWRSAHASALLRDVDRLRNAFQHTNQSALGACALAGTSFPIDRELTARLLGFPTVLENALDATSARDYLIETSAALAIGGTNISRMAEEIVIWSGNETRLVQVADTHATGSSIMPQKKNPVVAELARGRTGRLTGTLVQLLTMVKGVTLGYSCDLQEDKPFLWQAIDAHLRTLRVFTSQTRGLSFDATRGEDLCWDNFSTATELANYLVTERGMAFRQAHFVSGSLVSGLIAQNATLRRTELCVELLAGMGVTMTATELEQVLAPRNALRSYTSVGATSPTSVAATGARLRQQAAADRAWARDQRVAIDRARAVTRRAAAAVAAGSDVSIALAGALDDLSSVQHPLLTVS